MRLEARIARPAFSLMEMILALALGMVLLLGLYATLTTHFYHAQAGRDIVAESTLGRNVMARISDDILSQFGATDKRGLPDYAAIADAAAKASADGTAPAGTPTPNPDAVVVNRGVRGESNYIILTNFRVQRPRPNAEANTEISSDMRQTMYWIVTSGSDTLGLAKADIKLATSPDIDLDPTALPEQEKYVIAREVKSITFEYYDGTAWQTTWDGGAVDDTGAATGPPRAIRITMTLKKSVRGAVASETPSDSGPTFQTVVAIPSSNAFEPYVP